MYYKDQQPLVKTLKTNQKQLGRTCLSRLNFKQLICISGKVGVMHITLINKRQLCITKSAEALHI